jgi:hypothetical protein
MILKTFTIPLCEIDRMHKLEKYLNGNWVSVKPLYDNFEYALAIVSIRFPKSELEKFNNVEWIDKYKIYYKKVDGHIIPYNRTNIKFA